MLYVHVLHFLHVICLHVVVQLYKEWPVCVPNATDPLPYKNYYIESWRVIWWETTFFNMCKLNDGIMKKILLLLSLVNFMLWNLCSPTLHYNFHILRNRNSFSFGFRLILTNNLTMCDFISMLWTTYDPSSIVQGCLNTIIDMGPKKLDMIE